MKIRHYYAFPENARKKMSDKTLNKDNWDALRMDDTQSPFSIEENVALYEENCKNSCFYERAADKIGFLINKYKIHNTKLISMGVGKGILEWHLKQRLPEKTIECTDYTEKAIKKLSKVFLALDNAYAFDMLHDEYTRLDIEALFILCRVSTEFDRENWYQIFTKMYDAGIEHIIFIPTGLDTIRTMLHQICSHLFHRVIGKKDMFCGWLYSEGEFKKMFRNKGKTPLYLIEEELKFDGTAVFLLKRRE